MAQAIPSSAIRRSFQPSFFFWMTVVMTSFIFGGFGLTYWVPLASGTLAPLPPIVHLHGLFFFSWMVLLVVQSILINVRNVQLHRSLGIFGIAVASGVLILGALLTVMSARLGNANPSANSGTLNYLSVVAVLGFGILFLPRDAQHSQTREPQEADPLRNDQPPAARH